MWIILEFCVFRGRTLIRFFSKIDPSHEVDDYVGALMGVVLDSIPNLCLPV